jgi:murein DD-endopeptidase MepM/ murein hydrolase activator NlpD
MGRHGGRVHLLVIRDDGTRVLRVDVGRAVLRVAAAALLVAAGIATWSSGVIPRGKPSGALTSVVRPASAAALPADTTTPAPSTPATDATALSRRLAEMRAEVMRWRTLHAQIWRPLGPDDERRAAGVGGGTPTGVSSAATLDEQIAELADSLVDERQRLHTLASFMATRGALLRAMPMRWPVRGPVNSEFGRRISPWTGATEFHGGIDIAAAPGTPVKAPAGGRVVFAGASPGYGLTVIVEHVRDVKTLFGHLRDTAVTAGQRVEAGQLLARSGESGRTTGPHLHYEVSVRGQPVDPRGYLWE